MAGRYGSSPWGFEDLDVYKAAQAFRKAMYRIAKSLPDFERFALAQQMRRAAVSVTNNIAEGYGRYFWQESTQFCRHSRGSLMELVDDLNICEAECYVEAERVAALKREAETILKLLNGYIKYLQSGKQNNDS